MYVREKYSAFQGERGEREGERESNKDRETLEESEWRIISLAALIWIEDGRERKRAESSFQKDIC